MNERDQLEKKTRDARPIQAESKEAIQIRMYALELYT